MQNLGGKQSALWGIGNSQLQNTVERPRTKETLTLEHVIKALFNLCHSWPAGQV